MTEVYRLMSRLSEKISKASEMCLSVDYLPEQVSPQELMDYLSAESYEEDLIGIDRILEDDLLLLHEIVEISELKRMGFAISPRILMKAYPKTYEAHLTALEVEIKVAAHLGRCDRLQGRISDLSTYLDDEYLPAYLRGKVIELRRYAKSLLVESCHENISMTW